MQKQEFFAYQWHIDDNEPEITAIRVYGLTMNRKNVCVRVDNFTPYVYLELPPNYNWDHGYAQMVSNKIDELLGNKRPVQKALMYRAKLYGAHLNKDFTRKEFPYLFCSFSSRGDIKALGYRLKQPINVSGLGAIRLRMHEQDADPILQLVCCRNIPTAGWIKFSGKPVPSESQITSCDYEYCCSYKSLNPVDSDALPMCKVMGFDIEVNSTNPNTMPNADRPGDKVFQISCVSGYLDQPIEEYKEYILSLGNPDQEGTGKKVTIIRCETEADVLTGFTDLVRTEAPNMLVGYNIMGFDFPYMVARAKSNLCIFTFDQLGFHKYAHSKEREIKWSSSAYKNQKFSFLDAEGRLVVDLLPLVKRDFTKMNTYSLKNICSQFLGETKDPLTAKGIFKCYRIGTRKNENGEYSKAARKALGVCARYCVQDARLVVMLVLKFGTWPALTEMAKVCNTPIFALYTAGQQIKVFSQIYKHCFNHGIVVEKDAYIVREDERYVGAHVFPPIPGAYGSVVPLDFASLYPSIMIAYNIDYHTWVKDDPNIPDSMCNVYSWEDHINCVVEGTLINIGGYSVPIETLSEYRGKVLSYDQEKNGMEWYSMTGFFNQGIRECIELTFEDGSTIGCTPDHKFLTENGDWLEAEQLLPTNSRVCCSHNQHVLPYFYKRVIHVKSLGRRQVYDIEVDKVHNFLANGVVVHNCHHDPKVIRINDITKLIEKEQKKLKELRAKRDKTKDKEEKSKLAQQVKNMVSDLRPYTTERSNIKKTLPKHSMCAERNYRTLKEPLGVLPTVVKGFLDARAAVRGKQKVLAKQIDELKKKTDGDYSKEIKELYILYDILEKRQLAYKVSANSAYGAMGVRKGYLPFMIGAMIVTYMGRVNINKVAKTIPEKFGGHLVYGDSVTGDTPILCKINGKIAYRTIDNLPHSGYTGYRETKENAVPTESLEVWTETGFTHVKNIIRHKTTKRLFRVLTRTGVVDVTEDHGLLDTSANKVSILDLNIGNRLLTEKLPVYASDTCVTPESARNTALACRHTGIEIPDDILYSPRVIRQIFFDTYFHGATQVLMTSKIRSAKIYYLASSLGYTVTIDYYPEYKRDCYHLEFTSGIPDENVITQITELGTTTEYVYDLETENHHFSAGVGQLIVHNTDSNYVNFPHLKTAKEIWDHAVMVAKKVSEMFPPPMRIEFENVIYSFFMILTKKRYMYRSCGQDGVVDKKIGKKGVLLARRDNSKFVRDVYEAVIGMIADNYTRDEVLYYVLTELNLLCSHSKPLTDFTITKAVGDIGDMTPVPFTNEKGVLKAKIGDYTVPILDTDPDTRADQMRKKGAETEEEYYLMCLPAQVQLAERMRRRGQRVDPGTRLEYVVSLRARHTAKQYEKVESAEYMVKYGYILGIDYMYYIHALATPLDQVLTVIYGEDFVMKQYKFRSTIRKKVLDELNTIFSPKIVLEK